MKMNSSQELNVPVHFWNQLTAFHHNNEVKIAVERFHERFLSDSLAGLTVIES
jgi:hypothetical protein